MTTTKTVAVGRGWAYTGILLGGAVSIAANVAHSFIPPHGAGTDWHPEPGAVVGAIVWPVFLFIAIEIMARTAWPAGLQWKVLRWGGLLPVAAVAAFVSYRHLSGLLAYYGEERIVTILGPIAVDGLMAMATGALLAASHTLTTTPAEKPAVDEDPVLTLNPTPTELVEPVSVHPRPTVSVDELLPDAGQVVEAYRNATGLTIPADVLAERLRIDDDTATRLLAALAASDRTVRTTAAVPARINGTPVQEVLL